MCFSGIWGTVCDDFWDERDAAVACRQLGFDDRGTQAINNLKWLYIKQFVMIWSFILSGAVAVHSAQFGSGVGIIHLDNVQCNGSESRLTNCSHLGVGVHNCQPSKDAGVICSPGNAIA